MTLDTIFISLGAILVHLLTATSAIAISETDLTLNPVTGILEPPKDDTPVISSRGKTLTERATGPIVYLSNCRNSQPPYLALIPPPYTRSAIFSYPERSATLHGEIPSQQDAVAIGSGVKHWEGLMINAPFPSGETFTAYIEEDALSLPDFSYAGFGDVNGNGGSGYDYGFVVFSCFKDNERELFRTGTANTCFSMYYCLALG